MRLIALLLSLLIAGQAAGATGYCVMCGYVHRNVPPRYLARTPTVRTVQPTQPTAPRGNPLGATPHAIIESYLDLLDLTPADTVYDLGSGDGRVVIAAARRGARAVGVERMESLVVQSRQAIADLDLDDRAWILYRDLAHVDFSPATVAVLYLAADQIQELLPRLAHCRAVVSYQHAIPGARRVTVHGAPVWIREQTTSTQRAFDFSP